MWLGTSGWAPQLQQNRAAADKILPAQGGRCRQKSYSEHPFSYSLVSCWGHLLNGSKWNQAVKETQVIATTPSMPRGSEWKGSVWMHLSGKWRSLSTFLSFKVHFYGFRVLFICIDHVSLYQLSIEWDVFEIKDYIYLWHQNFLKYAPLSRIHRKHNILYNTCGKAP